MLCQTGAGSILALLKRSMWAIDMHCGVTESYSDFAFFDMDLVLTPEGRANVAAVVEAVFQGIRFLRDHGVKPAFFRELSVISLMDWIFLQREDPVAHAKTIAASMHLRFPRRRLLNFVVPFRFDAHAIVHLLNHLSRSNLNLVLSYRDAPATATEPLFGTRYAPMALPALTFPANLSLPPPNRFIVGRFVPKHSDLAHLTAPERIVHDEAGELWALATHSNSPKSIVHVALLSPAPATLAHDALRRLLAKMAMEGLDEVNFHLRRAGYRYAIAPADDGIHVYAKGFQQKLALLFAHVLQAPVDALQFEMFRKAVSMPPSNMKGNHPSREPRPRPALPPGIRRLRLRARPGALDPRGADPRHGRYPPG